MGPLRKLARRLQGNSAVVLAVILVCVSVTPVEAAFWYEEYEEAERALSRGDWTEAIERLQAALRAKGDPSSRTRTYGMNFIAYLPYYKLGIAYQELGEFEKAKQAYDASERAGAIQESGEDFAELERRRAAIEEVAAAEERQRIADLIQRSLQVATDLEQEGRYEEALSELEIVLGVESDNAEALLAQSRLQTRIRQREEANRSQQQYEQLLAQGRTQIENTQYAEAATTFGRALELQDTAEARSLRDQAQNSLREQLRAEQDAAQRQTTIASGIQQAQARHASGDLIQALKALEPVLALQPDHPEALQLRQTILREQALADAEARKTAALDELTASVQELFEAGREDEALNQAHVVLAQDPENQQVKQLILAAARRRLGSEMVIPPILLFFTPKRMERASGLEYAIIKAPVLVLVGQIIDQSKVMDLEVTRHPFDGRCPEWKHDTQYGQDFCDWDPALEAALGQPGTAIPHEITFTSPSGDSQNFEVRDQLTPGYWLYSIRAVNAARLDNDQNFIVQYSVPIIDRSWVRAIAGAVALALLSLPILAFTFRARRRKQRRKLQHNPYLAGLPAKGEQFYGREQLIQKILGRIRNNSILLHGERRIGKTSIQHELKSRLQEIQDDSFDYYPVYVTLEGTPQELLFVAIARALFEQLQSSLDGYKPNPKLDDGDYTFWDFRRDFRAMFKTLKQNSTKKAKIVLLVDEVDQLNEYEASVNSLLRSLFQDREADELVAVFSGVAINTHWQRRSSPWFNIFQSEEVRSFERQDAERLIRAPVKGLFRIDDIVVNKIIENAHGKPYYIQRICSAVVDRLYESKRRRMTLADVEAVGRPWGDIEE